MGKVNVMIVDVTGNKQQQAEIPDDAPVGRIIARLVELMGLPTTGPTGEPMNYKFHHKASGKQLSDEQTLAQANVQNGDLLRLQPEITAGGWSYALHDRAWWFRLTASRRRLLKKSPAEWRPLTFCVVVS